MRRDNVVFLVGGLAFGAILGYGLFYTFSYNPAAPVSGTRAEAPSSPRPASQAATPPRSGAMGSDAMDEARSLKAVLEADPQNVAALTRLANLYHDSGMWSQAVESYEKAIRVRPNDPNLLTDAGVCYQQMHLFDKALALFERAQRADPSHWQSLYNTVIVAGFNLRRFDEARAALQKLERLNPSGPDLRQLREELDRAAAQPSGGKSS